MSADVARGHSGDDGGDDRPPLHRGGQKPNRGGRKVDRLGTRGETRNLGLRKIMDQWGSQKIREFPMHYPSWHKIEPEKKAGVMGTLRQQFDLTPHIQSKLWLKIKKGIEQHLAKIYVDNKSSLKKKHWVLQPDETRDMESSETREYPSLIQTNFDTHTVDGVFLQDEARIQYEEMLRLRVLGANTPTGVPYTDDQLMAMVRRGKQRGHIPGVGRVLAGQGRFVISINEPRCTHTDADVYEVKKENRKLRKEVNMLMTVVKSDDRMSQLLTQL
ncbi:hypothetical protein Tco_0984722, partial [Tanacetum coccineum]